jgi:hypothetical protein
MLLTHILVALQLLHCYSISAHPLPAEDLVGLRTVETAREAAQSGHLTGPACKLTFFIQDLFEIPDQE